MAAQEALTGNKTIAALRRDSVRCLRAIALLQRRLKELQKTWPQAAPIPEAPERTQPDPPERTEPQTEAEAEADEAAERTHQNTQKPARIFNINGPVTENVVNLYRNIFGEENAEFVSHDLDIV
jgi:hypothetical protein